MVFGVTFLHQEACNGRSTPHCTFGTTLISPKLLELER